MNVLKQIATSSMFATMLFFAGAAVNAQPTTPAQPQTAPTHEPTPAPLLGTCGEAPCFVI